MQTHTLDWWSLCRYCLRLIYRKVFSVSGATRKSQKIWIGRCFAYLSLSFPLSVSSSSTWWLHPSLSCAPSPWSSISWSSGWSTITGKSSDRNYSISELSAASVTSKQIRGCHKPAIPAINGPDIPQISCPEICYVVYYTYTAWMLCSRQPPILF